jgi:hypothetical protein
VLAREAERFVDQRRRAGGQRMREGEDKLRARRHRPVDQNVDLRDRRKSVKRGLDAVGKIHERLQKARGVGRARVLKIEKCAIEMAREQREKRRFDR